MDMDMDMDTDMDTDMDMAMDSPELHQSQSVNTTLLPMEYMVHIYIHTRS